MPMTFRWREAARTGVLDTEDLERFNDATVGKLVVTATFPEQAKA